MLALEADKNGESPAELRRKVTSPKGTTEAALEIFAKGDFGSLVMPALSGKGKKQRAVDVGSENILQSSVQISSKVFATLKDFDIIKPSADKPYAELYHIGMNHRISA